MDGLGLLRLLIESTGLPPESIEIELRRLIEKHGFSAETLTMEQVREMLACYLQDVLLEAKSNAG
jgi:hypothetical protein